MQMLQMLLNGKGACGIESKVTENYATAMHRDKMHMDRDNVRWKEREAMRGRG